MPKVQRQFTITVKEGMDELMSLIINVLYTIPTKGVILLIRINFNPSMDKWLRVQRCVGWNYLFIPKASMVQSLKFRNG